MTQPVFRFAPSPNGRLHLGHAYSALLNADLSARWGGRFLVRVEDIDIPRCRPEFEAALYDDLAWLGLTWELPVRRQSEHFDAYRAAFERLKAQGLVYPCFCTRKEIATAASQRESRCREPWPRDPDGMPLYPGTCRALPREAAEQRIASGEPCAWRIRMESAVARIGSLPEFTRFDPSGREEPVEARPARWGDAAIVRKDIPTSYHLAVVSDDAVQGVTHVVRGADLEAATDLHVLLQRLLHLSSPRYHHHGLIRDGAGVKLSKSLGSTALTDLRAAKVTAGEIRAALGFAAEPDPAA